MLSREKICVAIIRKDLTMFTAQIYWCVSAISAVPLYGRDHGHNEIQTFEKSH